MPEYDYKQRPQTPEYQDGWARIWGKKPSDEPSVEQRETDCENDPEENHSETRQ